MDWVKFCENCWLCKYTRGCKKNSFSYRLARLIQKLCPPCYLANKKLQKNYQKSEFFEE